MDRTQKRVLLVMTSVAIVSLAVTCVTANLWALTTPLYTLRMEQASSEMNFLPTTVNEFTYTTENDFNMEYTLVGCCGAEPFDVPTKIGFTCDEPTCPNTSCNTCGFTCPNTCEFTCLYGTHCPHTCHDTCGKTCSTCPYTCETCTGC